MITKLATFDGVSSSGEPLVQAFTRGVKVKVAGSLMEPIQEWVKGYVPNPDEIPVLVNALGASEYWGQNSNGDVFPEGALIHDCRSHPDKQHPIDDFTGKTIPAYGGWTFLHAHPFVHHRNKDPSRAFGRVVLTCWNPRMHRVEIIVIINKTLAMQHGAQDVVDRITAGEFPDVSMGCLKKGAMISTTCGLKKVEEIVQGELVQTHLGSYRRVSETMVRPYEGDIYRVKVRGHRTPLVVTDEHPLWLVRKSQVVCNPSSKGINRGRRQRLCTPDSWQTKKGCAGCKTRPAYTLEWVRADEAEEGDYVAFPIPSSNGFELPTPQARLLGHYLADGFLLRTNAGNPSGVEFCIGLNNEELRTRIYSCLEAEGLLDKATEQEIPERSGRYITVRDRDLYALCEKHCGSLANSKALSQELLLSDQETLLNVLGAYADGDGGCLDGSLYLSTSSEVLSEQLRTALARCRMVASVNKIHHVPSARSVVQVSTIEYQVWVGTDSAWRLSSYTRHVPRESKRLRGDRFVYETDGAAWVLSPIESIDAEYFNDSVYNFSVEGHESYVANGVAVHNCRVPWDQCTICRHKSKTTKDYCNCITKFGMGLVLPDGRRVGVINWYPRFFDISFVFIGADKTAKVMCKLASGLYVPKSVADAYEVYGDLDKVGESQSVFAAESRSQGTHQPTRHYSVRGRTEDGRGRTVFTRHKPKPPVSVETEDAEKTASVNKDLKKETLDDYVRTGPQPKVLLSREDDQLPVARRAVEDGALQTNSQVNESEDNKKEASAGALRDYQEGEIKDPKMRKRIEAVRAYIARGGKVQVLGKSKSAESLVSLAARARDVRLGPPPKPNRKEYPFVGTLNFRGLNIAIENRAGSVREGTGPGGRKWRTHMRFHYGEFVGCRGVDGDKLDVYVGPDRGATNVYIVHQNHPRGHSRAGKYDEDKVMLGFKSPEEAKAAYLSQYSNASFFRSLTTMAFPLFKRAILGKEVDGEKVAAALRKTRGDFILEDTFEKTAAELDELFANSPNARRRERTWRDKVSGKETNVVGSGMASMDKAKTASARAKPMTIGELLKTSFLKDADLKKWADIVKEIGPSKAVGKVAPALSGAEESLPKEVLDHMSSCGMEGALATPSSMGMVLMPEEFQRVMLNCMGQGGLADKLDDAGAVFKDSGESCCPCECHSLGSGDISSSIMSRLMPFLEGRSYLGPVVKRRIIRISVAKPKPEADPTKVDSPLLSKVAAAYNWYRREQMKVASESPEVVFGNPELKAAVFGVRDEDLFSKSANVVVNPKSLGVVLAGIPLTLMYSAHLRGRQRSGDDLNLVQDLVADHPWMATVGGAAALREIMKSPHAQQAVDELVAAGRRVWAGKGSQPPVL